MYDFYMQTSIGQCVWYGICKSYTDFTNFPFTEESLYCNYNGAPKQLNNDALRSLDEYCPHLNKGVNNTYTCCDAQQVRHFIGI